MPSHWKRYTLTSPYPKVTNGTGNPTHHHDQSTHVPYTQNTRIKRVYVVRYCGPYDIWHPYVHSHHTTHDRILLHITYTWKQKIKCITSEHNQSQHAERFFLQNGALKPSTKTNENQRKWPCIIFIPFSPRLNSRQTKQRIKLLSRWSSIDV